MWDNTLHNSTQIQSEISNRVDPIVENLASLILQRRQTRASDRNTIDVVRKILGEANDDFFRMIANTHEADRDGNIADPVEVTIHTASSYLDAAGKRRSINLLSGIELKR